MLIINLIGISLIGLIVWWFWLYQEKDVDVSDKTITIIVENGIYQPSRIKLASGEATTLQFLRKDSSPCAGTLIIPDIEITAELPLNKKISISLPELEKGEYVFHCQMQMYKGTLLVE